MDAHENLSLLERLTKHTDIMFSAGVICVIGVMIIPMPSVLLDVLLAFNIAFSLVVLLTTLYVSEPLQFSVFPGLLLVVTLFRLSLNVASTRLILGEAYAGEVIAAFGDFVIKGNYVLGFVIFLILVIIQFVVITKGSGRIAEVAARFTLDAMPGKQMSIDADLNAGLITDDEARTRRADISREADFYGAMDGASKFVRGDAIAGILITLINILGGLAIGVLQKGMTLSEALKSFTLLTVGDGLVSQLPALILSTSAGILVTRTTSESNLGKDLTRQLSGKPKAIFVAAGTLLVLAVVPGLPTLPFLFLGVLMGTLAYSKRKAGTAEPERAVPEHPEEEPRPHAEEMLRVDPLEVQIGYGLIPVADPQEGGDLLDRLGAIREQIASELGMMIPPVRIRDNIQLKPNAYCIRVRGVELGVGELMPHRCLAIDPGGVEEEIQGVETVEPAFGLKAKWITESAKEAAELKGYTVVEAPAVLTTHLTEVIKHNAHEILGRQDVHELLEKIKVDYPAVVEDLVPQNISLGGIQRILQNLLRERVPIRDMITILETIGDYAPTTKDPEVLTEYVRHALSRTICQSVRTEDGKIPVIMVDPQVEQTISEAIQKTSLGTSVALPPEIAMKLLEEVGAFVQTTAEEGGPVVILTVPQIRLGLRRLLELNFPDVTVLSYNEIAPDVEVHSVGVLTLTMDNEQ